MRSTETTAKQVCSPEVHEQLKLPAAWNQLKFVGVADLGGMLIEHRNCECGSTLCVEVN